MKKVNSYIILMLALLMLLTVCSCSMKGEKQELQRFDIEKLPPSGSEANLSKVSLAPGFDASTIQTSAMVYKTSPVEISREEIITLAELLGISEINIVENDISTSISDGTGNMVIVFNASGSIGCCLSEERNAASIAKEAEMLSNDEYISIARAWLNAAGMLSDEYLEKEIQITDNDFLITIDEKGEEVSIPVLKTVVFMYRDLDGIEINGVAPRIIVDLSIDGKVVSVDKIQREFTPFDRYPLISIEEAIDKIENNDCVIYSSGILDDSGIIESCKLFYYNREVADDYEYLIPVFAFYGTSGEEQFTAVVIAVDDNYCTITDPQ